MLLKKIIKKLFFRSKEFKQSKEVNWVGSEYGGFLVDTSIIDKSTNVLSFGVGEDISFDLEIASLGVAKVFLFDPTPKSIKFINSQTLPKNFIFTDIGISAKNEFVDFFLPKNANHVSGSTTLHKNVDKGKSVNVELKKLSTILQEKSIEEIGVLKMDIEGAEYDVIENILSENIFPKQLCVEFHNEFHLDGDAKFKKIVSLLTSNNYAVAGISKTQREYLFIKK